MDGGGYPTPSSLPGYPPPSHTPGIPPSPCPGMPHCPAWVLRYAGLGTPLCPPNTAGVPYPPYTTRVPYPPYTTRVPYPLYTARVPGTAPLCPVTWRLVTEFDSISLGLRALESPLGVRRCNILLILLILGTRVSDTIYNVSDKVCRSGWGSEKRWHSGSEKLWHSWGNGDILEQFWAEISESYEERSGAWERVIPGCPTKNVRQHPEFPFLPNNRCILAIYWSNVRQTG